MMEVKLKLYFPALEGLNAAHGFYTGPIVLLSYNSGTRHSYPCGHTSDADRIYRCPPELVPIAHGLGVLASTLSFDNVIVFDMTGLCKGTGHRVTEWCPACLFGILLNKRPACAACNAPLEPGDGIFALDEVDLRKRLTRDGLSVPVAAMRIRGGKRPRYVCCDGPRCHRLRRAAGTFAFDPNDLEVVTRIGKRRSKKAAGQELSDIDLEIRGRAFDLDAS